jgi:threonine dehydratase
MQARRPDLDEIRRAQSRVTAHLHRTPLVRSRTLSDRTGLDLWLKCENLQRTGSFKPRGALNRIATLTPEQRDRGVITISAGNHAQGVAYAAAVSGVAATVVMPETAVASKVAATRAYGAEVVLHGDVHAAFRRLDEIRTDRGLTLVHPFDDPALVAGHATMALEIAEDLAEIDAVVCGIGGGGMLAGVASGFAELSPRTALYGVEPVGAATMTRALAAGKPVRLDSVDTIADGLAPPFVGELNLSLCQALVRKVITVQDRVMSVAMRLLLERAKLLVEPSGAAALGAILAGGLEFAPGSRVVVVLSGGNVDLPRLGELLALGAETA